MKDLFINYQDQPSELKEICDKWQRKAEINGFCYADNVSFLKEVEKIGYTFKYGLDTEPFELTKIQATKWSKSDVKFLKLNYRVISIKEISLNLQKKPSQIYTKISALNLREKYYKDLEYLVTHKLCKGKTQKEICKLQNISVKTMENLIKRLKKKNHAKTLIHLIVILINKNKININ